MMTIWVKSYSTLKFNSLNSKFAPENRVSKLAPKRKGLDFFSSSFFSHLGFPGFPLAVKSEVRWYFLIKTIQRLAEGVLQSWCGVAWVFRGNFRWRLRSFVSRSEVMLLLMEVFWGDGNLSTPQKMVSSFKGGFRFLEDMQEIRLMSWGFMLQQGLLNRQVFFEIAGGRVQLCSRAWLKGARTIPTQNFAKRVPFWGFSTSLKRGDFSLFLFEHHRVLFRIFSSWKCVVCLFFTSFRPLTEVLWCTLTDRVLCTTRVDFGKFVLILPRLKVLFKNSSTPTSSKKRWPHQSPKAYTVHSLKLTVWTWK